MKIVNMQFLFSLRNQKCVTTDWWIFVQDSFILILQSRHIFPFLYFSSCVYSEILPIWVLARSESGVSYNKGGVGERVISTLTFRVIRHGGDGGPPSGASHDYSPSFHK